MMPSALIIDDDDANIRLLTLLLTRCNVNSIHARSGKEGVALAHTYQPDVIFLDLRMPLETWDGYETITQLKSRPDTQQIPIVVATAAGDVHKAYERGCDTMLSHPFQIDEITKILSLYC